MEQEHSIAPDGQYAYPPAAPSISNVMASARVEHTEDATRCCTVCGEDSSCIGFVFEHVSRTCVLLPSAGERRLVPRYNAGMTSGFVRRFSAYSASPPPSPPPVECSLVPGQGWSGGRQAVIGPAQAPEGQLMSSAEVCCGVCAANPECSKFTFVAHSWAPGFGDCTLYTAVAEAFKIEVEGLVRGTVRSRDVALIFAEPPAPPHPKGLAGPSPPPVPPTFPFMAILEHTEDKSRGGARKEDTGSTSIVLGAAMSFIAAIVVIVIVLRWAFCTPTSTRGKFAPVAQATPRPRPGRATRAQIAMAEASDDEGDDFDDDGDGRGRLGHAPPARRVGDQKQLLQLGYTEEDGMPFNGFGDQHGAKPKPRSKGEDKERKKGGGKSSKHGKSDRKPKRSERSQV